MTAVLRSCAQLIVTCWRRDRSRTVLAVALMLAGAATTPLVALTLRWLTDAAVSGRSPSAALAGGTLAALAIAGLTSAHFAHIAYFELSELNLLDLDERMIMLANGSADLEHHERPEYADEITVLRHDIGFSRQALQALLTGAGLAVAMLVTVVLLASLNPLLLLLPLTALPPLYAGRHAERAVDRAKGDTAASARTAAGLFALATEVGPAREVRTLRLAPELLHRHATLWRGVTRTLLRAYGRGAATQVAGQLVFAAGYVGAVLLTVLDARDGQRSVGDVVLTIALAAQVNQQVATAVTLMQDLQRMTSISRRLAAITAMVRPDGSERDSVPPPPRMSDGIEFRGVTFGYPGASAPVLRDVNLRLPAGATVAVVGENGAGKTTLTKLLCGFYRPTAGQILIDGTPLRAMALHRWRERSSAVFQDFVRFEFTARHTVGLGDLTRCGDEPAVRHAIDRANATTLIDRLPHGLDTPLGTSLDDGQQPSGGQWQRLALARGLMRTSPLILILDEPASALDAEAEHALFDRYAAEARQASTATGAITLLVSHRFSTVQMADLIVVLSGGRVVQVGDHASLLARPGLYAELYALQAHGYR